MISDEEKNIITRFPDLELSYGQIDHTKVHFDLYSLIPMGKKSYAWFTYFQDSCVCYIVDARTHDIIEKVTTIFDESLSFGTIVYGTIINYNKNRFFVIEDLCMYKNKNLSRKKNYEKFNLLKYMIEYEITMKPYFNTMMTFGMPVMTNDFKEAITTADTIVYKIYAVQCIQMSNFKKYNKVIFKKEDEKERINVTLRVKPLIQNDIYQLFGYANGEIVSAGYAGIPTYEKSIMLNKLFRNIKENENLDRLEESDSDEEFEDINDDKFVDLNKQYTMECTFDYNCKKWVPNKVLKTNKLSNMKDVNYYLSKKNRINKNIKNY